MIFRCRLYNVIPGKNLAFNAFFQNHLSQRNCEQGQDWLHACKQKMVDVFWLSGLIQIWKNIKPFRPMSGETPIFRKPLLFETNI